MRISPPFAYIILYAALYAAFGVASPFWPRFLETRGLSPEQIGLFGRCDVNASSCWANQMLADRADALRLTLAICITLAAGSAAALLSVHSFALLFFVIVIQGASLAPTTSLADALSINATRPQFAGKDFEYGWIGGSASLAFIFGTLIIGQLISRSDVTP
jgi:MFS transporter, PPP family, 3-phenylpropionic acid transporter